MKILHFISIILILAIGWVIGSEAAEVNKIKIFSSDAAVGEGFGSAVAISGETAVVGAPKDDEAGVDSGSAQIFVRSGGRWLQQAKLLANDAAVGDAFGISAAISGDYTIVGAERDDDGAQNSGSAYIFERSGTSWAQRVKLTAIGATAEDRFGHSVDISGDTAIVGAPNTNNVGGFLSGAAYIFVRIENSWILQAKITPWDAGKDDKFGFAVSISGDTAIVGAYQKDHPRQRKSGSAYIFVRNGTRWTEQQKLIPRDRDARDLFGWSVAISGDFAIVGAPNTDDAGSNSGSAYIFERSGSNWKQRGLGPNFLKLVSRNADQGEMLGWSVAISGDTAIVGVKEGNTAIADSGSAYIFERSRTIWKEHTQLIASDPGGLDKFGGAVAIDEDIAIVGAPENDAVGTDSGSMYTFQRRQRRGINWVQEAKLTGSGGAVGDQFGYAVAISEDTVIVGSRQDDDTGSNAGSAYILVRRGIGSDTSFVQQAKLIAGDTVVGDLFGNSVSVSGSTAIVGAYQNDAKGVDSGSTYIFNRSETRWTEQSRLTATDAAPGDWFGFSVAISGDTAVVGAPKNKDAGFFSGSAYIFVRNGIRWAQEAKLVPSDTAIGDQFGYAVAIREDTVIVGAPGHGAAGTDSGSAYIFMRNTTGWAQEATLTRNDAAVGDRFGYAVAISQNTAIVGAPQDDDAGTDSGSAYIFAHRDGSWIQQLKLTASDATSGDQFGASVAVSRDTAIVGAWQDDHEEGGIDSGAIYFFVRSLFSWREKERLVASDASDTNVPFILFGVSVGVSRNFVVAGAYGDRAAGIDAGAVHIYHFIDDPMLSVEGSLLTTTTLGHLKRTSLFQNYPNPFNPETWLPYQLATDAQVTFRIYDLQGQLVRQLALGAQLAGSYTSKNKSAYWDGKDRFGQVVSSGIYFYTLEAGRFEATRRMIIVK